MKSLKSLLRGVACTDFVGPEEQSVNHLVYDSRQVAAGDCFFAVVGSASDGHDYIPKAIEAGARTVVCQHLPQRLDPQVSYVVVAETNAAMAEIASNYYENPSRELKLVGVTGTNGKTTTATLLADLFQRLGYRTGLISTVVYRVGDKQIPSTHTTPDTLRLNALLREMVDAGCDYCFMEVSSHAIAQHRVAGLHFAGGLFTNLTHDHLDYHKTFAEYLRVKKSFFDTLPKEAFALVNIDDKNGRVMVQNTRARVQTLSLQSPADFRCKIIEMQLDGMLLQIDGREVWLRQLGRFNAYNLLTIYSTALLLGAEREEVLRLMSTLDSVSGRFETIHAADGTVAIVDYAHTPDALENVIRTIEEIRRPEQQLIVLCGCGGDRDRTKRPEMAQIAVKYASLAIFTSDNPRSESPEAILDDMVEGLDPAARYLRIAHRGEAIRTAALMAKAGDIILLAGKGHETYQIIGTESHHFDDKEEISVCLQTLHHSTRR
ncbi:MAG: UDP-N-acetylmuramoyl-L-alanyl-D-glutamate--2,6-diaminopimelate ligase [Rikenellaceae bacterium]|nr:UDP-N-acetylmuramoyl-L-alanyl-D-glutamate--2,6-diaminopimelate ligase [Rikenellaceae bacterium]